MDVSVLIGILGELGRPDLIDSMLEPGHTLAVAGHVKPGLRRRKTGSVSSAWCVGARFACSLAVLPQSCGGYGRHFQA